MYRHQYVILHTPAKFRTSWAIGGGVMTSCRISRGLPYSRKCTSGFRLSDSICL